MSYFKKGHLSKIIFFILVFLLPLNLGKHFINPQAYVSGLLVDYLVPVVYIQDILIVLILTAWAIEKKFKLNFKDFINRRDMQVVIFFLFSLFLSIFRAQRIIPAEYYVIEFVLYAGLYIYVTYEISFKKDFNILLGILGLDILLLSILGIVQFIQQGSVFNNYLFFGEQPYVSASWGLIRENFFGIAKVPAYGLFRHPNIFGGFLSITLIWLFSQITKKRICLLPFVLGLLTLVLTVSITAWIVFILGVALWFFANSPANKKISVYLVSGIAAFLFIFPAFRFVPAFDNLVTSSASLYRRANLLIASYRLIQRNFLFGIGANNLTAVIEKYIPLSRDIRFDQPVHNIFVLVLAESGIFAFSFFVLLFYVALKKLMAKDASKLLFITILQIVLLGSFDHYFMTIQQTQLLLWIILGLV
jgi:putative inorganic carbon (hco3(-)) transporter